MHGTYNEHVSYREAKKRSRRILYQPGNQANCLNASLRAGQLETLPAITSVAKSLGALRAKEDLFGAIAARTTPAAVYSSTWLFELLWKKYFFM